MAEELISVGVPEIVPVEFENERPAGRDGLIDHDVAGPPLAVGVAADIVPSFVSPSELDG